MKSRILVTGASGFIGAHVVRALTRNGRSVRALVHRSPAPPEATEQVQADLRTDGDLSKCVAECSAVVHCAALLDPVSDEELADRVNHRASVALALAAARAGVDCFVFLSSMAALGYHPGSGLLAPSAPCRPSTAYGRSKLAAERGLLGLASSNMRVVILRPPTVYGPGETRNFLALTRAIDSRMFFLPGPGRNRMSFCWVGNLTEAVVFAVESPAACGVLHVAEAPVTLKHAAETIAHSLGTRLLPVPLPLPIARGVATFCELTWGALGRTPPLSRARLRTLTSDCALDTRSTNGLGLVPSTSFETGVRLAIDDYKKRGLVRAR